MLSIQPQHNPTLFHSPEFRSYNSSVPKSEFRKDFNKTGGVLDPILARAIREKVQDKSAPKKRTDVERIGMRTVVNKYHKPKMTDAKAIRAEKVRGVREKKTAH